MKRALLILAAAGLWLATVALLITDTGRPTRGNATEFSQWLN